MDRDITLGILGFAGALLTGLIAIIRTLLRQRAAREIAERAERQVFIKFLTNDYHETLQDIAKYMGEQTKVLVEIREDLRDLRRRGP